MNIMFPQLAVAIFWWSYSDMHAFETDIANQSAGFIFLQTRPVAKYSLIAYALAIATYKGLVFQLKLSYSTVMSFAAEKLQWLLMITASFVGVSLTAGE